MNLDREIALTRLLLVFTVLAAAMAYAKIAAIGVEYARAGDRPGIAVQTLFALVVAALVYSYFVYLVTRVGQLQGRRDHVAADREELEAVFDGEAPALAVLVPSYKEETAVVRRTLLSAALQEYPRRRVVLLIDDPPQPTEPGDVASLAAMRGLPRNLQALFDPPAERWEKARQQFTDRCRRVAFDGRAEAAVLARSYVEITAWFDRQIASYRVADHADRVFVTEVLQRWREANRDRALRLTGLASGGGLDRRAAACEYERLATLFRVHFASFERKQYANLSHQANKAMNLNSYIALMGRSFREVREGKDMLLREVPRGPSTFDVPDAALLLTLDADSVIVPDYALRLAHLMSRPGNGRVAVAQTPYSAFPGAPGVLERVAGATTDIQFLIHQGFTRYNATFWVGANALLRKVALEDIVTEHEERGHPIRKYIQDRTVIEDTESSIDLADRGWTLFNYPERMAYSATPADFGALLIQRRRWANGGLIILPKALRHLFRGPQAWCKLPEGFCRVHYLTSIATANLALLLILFGVFERNMHIAWLFVCSLPYIALYARDLVQSGYRMTDILRVYALNLLLLPVHLGGVLKSLHQAITGLRTPFGRTPKVMGRTAAPAGYVLAEYGFLVAAVAMLGFDLLHHYWLSATLALTYTLFCSYAILHFVGVRNSAEDLGLVHRDPAREKPEPLPASASRLESPAVSVGIVPRPLPNPSVSLRAVVSAPLRDEPRTNDEVLDGIVSTDRTDVAHSPAKRARRP
jgi:cellulose synthase/poly-beta-1,6-N-acetylglucosamine synthase-like glycosyltransferase